LHKIHTAENRQSQKRGRNEIITVATILLTHQIVLTINFVHCLWWVHTANTISYEFLQILW